MTNNIADFTPESSVSNNAPEGAYGIVSDRKLNHGAGRMDDGDAPWPARAWIMALVGAVAGLIFWGVAEKWDDELGERGAAALATGLAIAAVSFLLGVEQRRWTWAVLFSLFWGAVGGLIFWQSMGAHVGSGPFAWPFFSVVLAILIATPFFQTWRDVTSGGGQWRLWQLPYGRLHDHAWIDAVLGAAALLFIGICFAMLGLIGEMFKLIGIKFVSNLFNHGWFMFALAGAAFGAAVGLLRERDRLVSVMQRLVMVVLSVLAPVLAVAVGIFLLSLPLTGLNELWNNGFSAAYLLLTVAAASLLLANAVIGNGDEEGSQSRVMRRAAAALAVMVLPLAVLAATAMALRIEQYGWTPARLWGAIAVLVAVAYGLAGVVAVLRGRGGFALWLRDAQQKLSVGVMVIAFFLALPILDFGAISARDQVARLNSGAVTAKEFDWAAMAHDFGPSGRRALEAMAAEGPAERKAAAAAALKSKSRWDTQSDVQVAQVAPLDQRLRILPQGAVLPEGMRAVAAEAYICGRAASCAAIAVSDTQWVLLVQMEPKGAVASRWFTAQKGHWIEAGEPAGARADGKVENGGRPDLREAKVETRDVTRKQIFIDGEPSGPVFE